MPDDPYDDWFESDPDEPRQRPEPVRRARGEPPPSPAARRPALVAAAAVLAVVVLVVILIASAISGGDDDEGAPPAATGELIPPAETGTVPTETGPAAEPPPPETGPALPATGPLRLGDEGEEVRALQQALVELGFDPGEPDGVFGEQTRVAVRSFQEQQGLSADGVAGAETLEAIRNALAQTQG